MIEFNISSQQTKTLSLINFQQNSDAYYNILVYRLDSVSNLYSPISVMNKEVLVATYNPNKRELQVQYSSSAILNQTLTDFPNENFINIRPIYFDVPLL